jgi:coenzyme PQQ biosynthesis protein PqqD
MEREKLVPKQKSDFQLEQMDNEILLYHPGQTKTIYLNETASLIWQLCDGSRTVGEIAQLLKDAFPDGAESMEGDIEKALAGFEEHGAIEYLQ